MQSLFKQPFSQKIGPSVSPIAAQLKTTEAGLEQNHSDSTLIILTKILSGKTLYPILLRPCKSIIELAILKVEEDWKLACSAKICL